MDDLKQLLNELEMGKSLLFLLETLVLAVAWFFVLRAFSGLALSDIPFTVGFIYVLGFVFTFAAMYTLMRLSISMRTLSQDIIVRMEIEDIVARRRGHRHHGFGWTIFAVVFVICTLMATQGPAIIGAHLLMPFFGKPALADGIRNFAIGMAVGGNLLIFIPAITAWAGIKLLHNRIVTQRKINEDDSPSSDTEVTSQVDVERVVSRVSRPPVLRRRIQHFPTPLTGPVRLAKSYA